MKAPIAALALCLVACTAQAKPAPYRTDKFIGDRYAGRVAQGASAADVVRSVRATRRKARHKTRRLRWAPPLTLAQGMRREASAALGGRPKGCPNRFCGCALSLKLFGRIIPHLNLAANWRSFPRSAPQSGMVAARRGHVFQLLAHRSGSTWQVWDANSGGGRIRIHDRSIAGYAIVNPHFRSVL
jgi:hypothetical protein